MSKHITKPTKAVFMSNGAYLPDAFTLVQKPTVMIVPLADWHRLKRIEKAAINTVRDNLHVDGVDCVRADLRKAVGKLRE